MKWLSLIILNLICSTAVAKSTQFNARVGPIGGTYTGPVEGSFYVPNAVDFDYAVFVHPRKTMNFRAILALELPESLPFYTYAGVGTRYYMGSSGFTVDRSEGMFSLESMPARRYYLGYDIGISQAIIKSFGTVLQAVSLMLDAGAIAGATFQVNKKMGVDVSLGTSAGFGFSSIGAVGYTWRFLVGATYNF